MSWTIRPRRFFRSVAFNLTLFYAVLFGLVSCAGVFLIYFMIVVHLRNAVDAELVEEKDELAYYVIHYDTETIRGALSREAELEGPDRVFCRLVSSSGQLLASSDMSAWPTSQVDGACNLQTVGIDGVLKTITLEDERRKARILSAEVAPGKILQMGTALDKDERFLAEFRYKATMIVIAMLTLGTFIGWGMARKAMAGVEQVTQVVKRIAEGRFHDRVRVAKYGEEIARLGETFNRMAERIQKLMTEMREVNDNIAHDLRNPVTRIRGLAETTITGKATLPEYEEFAGRVVEECDRLLHMVNTMLDISEVEAGIGRLNLEEVDLAEMACQATDLFQPVAEEKRIVLRAEISPTPPVRGDLRRVQHTLANLIDNALKYTDPGGEVVVSLTRHDKTASIAVRDTGPGIPDQERARIFERFFRGDHSRCQPGNGLGLSLARAVARAHGGDITVDSSPEGGSTFTIMLPIQQSGT